MSGFIIPFLIEELMDYNYLKRERNNSINNNNERDYKLNDYNFGFIVIIIVWIGEVIISILLKQPQFDIKHVIKV